MDILDTALFPANLELASRISPQLYHLDARQFYMKFKMNTSGPHLRGLEQLEEDQIENPTGCRVLTWKACYYRETTQCRD